VKDNAGETPRLGSTPAAGRLPYGPGTTGIRRFLQHAAALGGEDWALVIARHEASAATAVGQRADRALGAAIENAGLQLERDALVGPVIQLAQRVGGTDEAAWEPAAEALLSASLALLASHLLEPSTLTTLYAPFAPLIPPETLER
jgi:hypothetical protein